MTKIRRGRRNSRMNKIVIVIQVRLRPTCGARLCQASFWLRLNSPRCDMLHLHPQCTAQRCVMHLQVQRTRYQVHSAGHKVTGDMLHLHSQCTSSAVVQHPVSDTVPPGMYKVQGTRYKVQGTRCIQGDMLDLHSQCTSRQCSRCVCGSGHSLD